MLSLRCAAAVRPALTLGVRHMSRIGKRPVLLPDGVTAKLEPYPMEELLPVKPLSEKGGTTGHPYNYLMRHSPNKDSFQMFGDGPKMLLVEGPLGSLKVPIHSFCDLSIGEVEGAMQIAVEPECKGKSKMGRSLWGTLRTYIAGAVQGVSQGFRKELEIHGVGNRARVEPPGGAEKAAEKAKQPTGKGKVEGADQFKSLGMRRYGARKGAQAGILPVSVAGAPEKGDELVLRLGVAHEIRVLFPPHVTVVTPTPTQIVISGIDRQSVGQAAARVRMIMPPDPYKGKGLRYVGEPVKLRAGKRR